jgi:hypothetical protein
MTPESRGNGSRSPEVVAAQLVGDVAYGKEVDLLWGFGKPELGALLPGCFEMWLATCRPSKLVQRMAYTTRSYRIFFR